MSNGGFGAFCCRRVTAQLGLSTPAACLLAHVAVAERRDDAVVGDGQSNHRSSRWSSQLTTTESLAESDPATGSVTRMLSPSGASAQL